MASYDLKAILGEKLKLLTDKMLKALVDCMCTVGASLCSLDKRVSALENVDIPEGGYKPVQEPVASPTASGNAIQFIDTFKQDANGVAVVTKKTVRSASSSQSGVMSAAHYAKLEGIAAGAEVNVQADWAQTNTNAKDFIKNKPDFTTYYPEYDDSSEFGKIRTAYNAGKQIVLIVGETGEAQGSGVAQVRVPLSKVIYSGSTITSFYFEYCKDDYANGLSAGEIAQFYCDANGWGSRVLTVVNATLAGTANTALNANITRTDDASNGDVLQIGTGTAVNVVNAKNATNDSLGGSIKDIYICDLKKVNTATESGYVFSGFSVKNDDSAIGNRRYIEALYSAFPHPKMWFLPIPVQDSTTSDNVHLEDINGGYYSVACHKDAEHSTIITDTFTSIGYGVFEIDFDYRILKESSSSTRVGLKFALCALSNAGTSSPTKKVSVNDTTIFASATESFDGSTSAWFGGHVHMIGYISNASGSFASSKSVALLAGFTLGEIKIGGGYNTGYLVTDNITVKAYNKHL